MPVLVVDDQCEMILHANGCGADFFLMSAGDMCGRRVSEIVGDDAQQVLGQVWSRSALGFSGEPFLVRAAIGGQERLLVVRATRLVVDDELVRLFTFADAPPQGSIALAGWQDSMMEILNWMPFGFEISDNSDQIQFANAYCKRLFGYSQQQLQTADDWWRLAYPDPNYRAYAQAKWEKEISDARRENREMTPFDLEVTTASGETRTIQFRHRTIGNFNINLFLDFTRERAYQQELTRLAGTDGLTGIMNRRRFFEVASQTFEGAAGTSLAALMLDIDHFKQVNDAHGHGGGDIVLQEFTRRCSEVLRRSDLFARFGGEEFVVLLPDTGIIEASKIAERLRSHIDGRPFPVSTTELRVSMSIGGTWCLPNDTLDTMLARADRALYAAKRLGRNRVVIE